MKENWLKIFLKGLCVGGTMLVPGVSGGSMAMILGIYSEKGKGLPRPHRPGGLQPFRRAASADGDCAGGHETARNLCV